MSLPTNLSKPYTMVAGTDALAADVNGDFDYVVDELNDTNEYINNLLDTDGTLSANSDSKVATQKATKTYVDATAFSSTLPGQSPATIGMVPISDGTAAAWGLINVSGGATSTTSAVDITLTAASPRVQVINMTATGKVVTLPDATTMSEGGISYIFRATGYSYMVLSSTGKFVGTAESGTVLQVCLVDNSTAAGTWSGQVMTDTNPGVGVGVASVFESASTNQIGSVWLDDDRCFVAYKDIGNSNYMTGCVLTKSGTTFTPGTPFVIVSANCTQMQCSLIGTDKVVITYYDAHGKAIALTISGTTSGTIGTPVAIATTGAGDASAIASCRLADDAVFVAYKVIATNYLTAKVLTVSGTTITANTADTVDSSEITSPACSLLESGKVIVTYARASDSRAVVCSVTGTTVTHGAAVNAFGSVVVIYNQLVALTSTEALALYYVSASTSIYYCILNISGTTVTYGTPIAFDGSSAQYPGGLVRTSDTTAIGQWFNTSAYMVLSFLSVLGTTMTSTEFSTSQLTSGVDNTYGSHLTRNANGDICCDYKAASTNYGTALLLVG